MSRPVTNPAAVDAGYEATTGVFHGGDQPDNGRQSSVTRVGRKETETFRRLPCAGVSVPSWTEAAATGTQYMPDRASEADR
jgi:hypothetical protein